MKRIWGLLVVLSALASTQVQLVGAIDTQNFHFSSFKAEYQLGRDKEKRSILTTKETLVAEFPEYDQNHGIERAIPKTYNGHSTSLDIVSVRKENGDPWKFTTYESNGNEVLRIGDANSYVRGKQTYVITYMQRDVTQYFKDTNDDEFYWDTNGTQWAQAFQHVEATITLHESLKNALTSQFSCAQGASGSTEPCDIIQNENGSISMRATRPMMAYENATFAIGFKPNTFAPYKPSFAEQVAMLWGRAQTVLIPLGIVLCLFLWVLCLLFGYL